MQKVDWKWIQKAVIIVILCLVVLYFPQIGRGIVTFLDVLFPLILGCVMAYILNILMRALERWYFPNSVNSFVAKSRRPVCLTCSFLILFIVVAAVVYLVVPELVSCMGLITREIPLAAEELQDWVVAHIDELPNLAEKIQNMDVNWGEVFQKVSNYIVVGAGGLFSFVMDAVMGVVSAVSNFVLALIFAIYLLLNKERLASQIKRVGKSYGKPSLCAGVKRVLVVADTTFSKFIIGQCTEALILGSLCAIGMLVLRLPYAAMTGAVIGITALIPILGAYVGGAVGAFMIFTVDPWKAVVFLIFLVILQQVEGNLIYPKVVGASIGLPGIWVFAAVTVGGGIMGIIGMLFAVPVAATAYKLLAADVKERLAKKKKLQKPKETSTAKKQQCVEKV